MEGRYDRHKGRVINRGQTPISPIRINRIENVKAKRIKNTIPPKIKTKLINKKRFNALLAEGYDEMAGELIKITREFENQKK